MFINWNTRELQVKLVYYGPPLSGKTTNLERLHHRLPQNKRTDLLSVKTREDRTLFFDFMQVELNEVKGLQPKFKLYTVPGQVYYEATRKLVLRDADGVVFVADSSLQRLAANRRAIQDMNRQLSEMGKSWQEMPLVLQCNKQDGADAVKPALLARFLGVSEATPVIPAAAIRDEGVTETLRLLIQLVLTKI